MLTTANAMLKKAETFILQLLGKEECASFNELRYIQYYDSQKHLSLTKLVCCSSSLQYHLKRAYLQTHIWLNGASQYPYKLEPTSYGYKQTEIGSQPQFVKLPIKPKDFPLPLHVHVRYVLPRDHAHAEQQEYLVLCTVNVRCQAVAIQINEVNYNFKKRRLINLNLKSLLNCTIDEVCPSLVMVLINIMPSKLGVQ